MSSKSPSVAGPQAGAEPSPFKPVEQPQLYVVIAREIAAHILGQKLERGAQLPPERDLARQYQVSRATLREAMIALETIGMVEVRVGDGTFVTDPTARWPNRWDGVQDPGPGPHEQFRLRALLECAAAEDAAANISDDDLKSLRNLLDLMAADIDGPEAEEQRRAFHMIIAKASGNLMLADLIDELWRLRSGEIWKIIRSRMVRASEHAEVLKDREALYHALLRRNGTEAAQAMGRVMDRIRQRYFSSMEA